MSNNPFDDLASHLEAITYEEKRYVGALASLAGEDAWFEFHARVMHSLFEAKELARASGDPQNAPTTHQQLGRHSRHICPS